MISGIEILEDNDDFIDIFTKTGALAYEKQRILNELLEGDTGNLNIEEKVLEFKNYTFPIQILGTLSLNDNMWYWAWDNQDIGFSDDIIQDAKKIREIGDKYNLTEFNNKMLSNVDIDSIHTILMPTSTLIDADAYYGAQEGDLVIFVAIHSEELELIDDIDVFARIYNNFVRDYKVKAVKALEGYSKFKEYEFRDEIEFAVVKTKQQRIIVGFSEQGNLTNIQTMK